MIGNDCNAETLSLKNSSLLALPGVTYDSTSASRVAALRSNITPPQCLYACPSSLGASMPSDFVIDAWRAEVDAATRVQNSSSRGRTLRKRARPAAEAEALSPGKQHALAPAAADMNPPPSPLRSNSNRRPRSPAKPINQTLDEAYKKPAVISIATRIGFFEEEDARFKLGIWIVAWQNRIAAFRPGERLPCTPLPGLMV